MPLNALLLYVNVVKKAAVKFIMFSHFLEILDQKKIRVDLAIAKTHVTIFVN